MDYQIKFDYKLLSTFGIIYIYTGERLRFTVPKGGSYLITLILLQD